MSASRTSSSSAVEIRATVANIRQHVAKGTTEKLLEDENFVFQMLKLMVEDGVDTGTKIEFLRVLEDCGGDVLESKIVNEVASNLFGIFHQYQGREDCVSFLVQLLITVTTLLVTCSDISSDLIASLVEILWSLAAKVNDVNQKRLRAIACQCMAQIEDFSPGVMWKWRDRLLQAVKLDRSDVCQDYVTLLTTVLYHMSSDIGVPECPLTPDSSPRASFDRTFSNGQSEILSAVSFIMEHSSVFTPAGLWDIVTSVTGIVRSSPGISPSIYKPLMLHHMATQDPCLLHVILFLQNEFAGEILTAAEEKLLLTRLMTAVNQRSLNPAHRLLCLQWLKGYCQLEDEDEKSHNLEFVRETLAPKLYPTVFDSVDSQVGKIVVHNTCTKPQTETDCKELSPLLMSLGYLKKLSVCTGHNKVAVSLYRVLYTLQTKHNTPEVAATITKICRSVLGAYPKLIPLVLDFLLCLRQHAPDSVVYMDILTSLHKQVLSSRPQDVLQQFEFYLLVLKTSAKEMDINPLKSLQYLLRLVQCAVSMDQCSWTLGNAVLNIVRCVLIHHSTEGIFTELGELLHETMLNYMDIDIQDKARFYYALLTGASDKKLGEVLSDAMQGGSVTEQSFSSLLPGSLNQPMRTELHHVEEPILKWERISLQPIFEAKSTLTDKCDIGLYKKLLEKLKVSLQIKHSLRVLPDCHFDTLHAVSVKLDSDNTYRLVKDIHIACMNRNDTRELDVLLQPSIPRPSRFITSAMFASHTNDTYICSLPDTVISFTDLLLPFPWTQVGVVDHSKEEFFTELWNEISGCSDPSEGIESVKVVSGHLKRFQEEWKPYQVSQDSNNFLFFLPAKYHLLFKLQERPENVVVSMATDNWKILTNINDYLQTFDS